MMSKHSRLFAVLFCVWVTLWGSLVEAKPKLRHLASDESSLNVDELQASEPTAHPCYNDYLAHCARLPWGKKGLGKCLREHKSELSAACKMRLEKQSTSVCRDARRKYCKGMPWGPKLRECIEAKAEKVSKPCLDRIRAG